MKILQVHNYYITDGGEEVVVKNERRLLEEHGHLVLEFSKDNHNLSIFDKLKQVFTAHYSKRVKKEFSAYLKTHTVDVIHIHNTFPQITPSVLDSAVALSIPVVFTLHNYRLVYPNGLLYYNGKIDERSLQDSAFSCVWDGVYRNSVFLTALVAHHIEYHRKKSTWKNKVDQFIIPTNFAKKKLIEGGLPSHKMVTKPHFLFDPVQVQPKEKTNHKNFLFIGRIIKEKGIDTVLKAWEKIDSEYNLLIVGEGPLKATLMQKYVHKKNIQWVGKIEYNEVFRHLQNSEGMIFSSEWYETFGLTIIEAYGSGVPVICSNLGSHAELVDDHKTGLLYEAGNPDDLAIQINKLISDKVLKDQLGKYARKKYKSEYAPEKNYQELMHIYKKAIQHKKRVAK
jgi:glycosyltransferase involved in cell wall biosynthesis